MGLKTGPEDAGVRGGEVGRNSKETRKRDSRRTEASSARREQERKIMLAGRVEVRDALTIAPRTRRCRRAVGAGTVAVAHDVEHAYRLGEDEHALLSQPREHLYVPMRDVIGADRYEARVLVCEGHNAPAISLVRTQTSA